MHVFLSRPLRGRAAAVAVLVAGLLGGHVSAATPAGAEPPAHTAPGHLDPGRTAAHHHEREARALLLRV